MASIQSLAISIILVSFFAINVYSQEQGLVVVRRSSKNNNNAANMKSYACKCFMRSDPDESPKEIKKAGDFNFCDIISRQGSTVSLTVRSTKDNNILYRSIDCSLQGKEEMKKEFWADDAQLFEKSSCILITNMNIKEPTHVLRTLFYSFILIILVMSTLYAAHRYRFNPWAKLRERWQTQQEWDRLPLYVNF